MQLPRTKTVVAILALGLALAPAAHAGIIVYEDEESGQKVEIGGRIHIQYHLEDPDGGDSTDELFFRRVRPEFNASINEDWDSRVQLEVGEAEDDNELSLRDVYVVYKGWEGVTLTMGNQKPPASREFLTSSNEQQLVERTFVGDHNYGDLDRVLAAQLKGKPADGKLQWAVAAGSASIDPDASRLDFDTPVNRNSDFNEGWVLAAGLDFFPMGEVKFSQGDLERGDTRVGFRIYGSTWSNDGDNDTYTEDGVSIDEGKVDIDSVTGFGGGIALRSHGLSVDAEYRQADADTVPGDFTGGLYRFGETTLDAYALEGGYAFSERFEIVAGYSSLDADNYEDSWNATSVGFNTFFEQHKAKLQLTYQMGENVDGISGVDADDLFLQLQYAF
ncbi:MAG: porin [Thermoanaerobaculia bacterium]